MICNITPSLQTLLLMKTETLSLIDLHSLYELIVFFRKNTIETYFALIKNEELKTLIKSLNDFYKDLDWTNKVHIFNDKNNLSSLANVFHNLNLAYTNFKLDKNPRNQLRFYNIILKILSEYLPPYHSTIAFIHSNIALILLELKDKTSLEHFEKSLTIYQRLLPENDKILADTFCNLGLAYKSFNQTLNSLINFTSALKIHLPLPDNISLANTFIELANIYLDKEFSDPNKALHYLKNACHLYFISGAFNKKLYNLESTIKSLQKSSQPNTPPSLILSYGKIDKNLILLKHNIQTSILNPITNAIDTPSPLVLNTFKINHLEKLLNDNSFLEPALMLCFEAINLGIMKSEKKPYSLAIYFAKSHPDLIKKIAIEHPEYFVDGSIIDACLKAITYDITPLTLINYTKTYKF